MFAIIYLANIFLVNVLMLKIYIVKIYFLFLFFKKEKNERIFMEFETIVALATPPGNSGVAVVRISGKKSKQIAQKIIKERLIFEPRKMYLKKIHVKNFVDYALVVFFPSPHSYTGEDVVEIQAHGGYFLARCIIDEVVSLGARLATAGEFSKRAFLNGKMSLDQAEAIMDIINAETDMQAKFSTELLQGNLRESIENHQNELTDILAEIEAKLDYPEYEFSASETTNTLKKLKTIETSLNNLVADSKNGLIIKNGVKIAIVGAPNVGKSSLLNALTKSEKAIVTDIAGTTRDVVEAEYQYNGIIFRLFDTAGIHDSTDTVEKIGITRAIKTIDECDLVLRLSEPNAPCQVKTKKPHIDVINKMDLISLFDKRETENPQCHSEQISTLCHSERVKRDEESQNPIYISAKTGEGVDELKQLIFEKIITSNIDQNKFYLTNTRHIECVKAATAHLKNAIKNFNTTTMDIISAELKSAWTALGEISGTTANETIIDKIFSKFCLGK